MFVCLYESKEQTKFYCLLNTVCRFRDMFHVCIFVFVSLLCGYAVMVINCKHGHHSHRLNA